MYHVYTVAVSSWFIPNNFVIDFYCRCLEILCQIALSSIANYFRSYSLLQFGIKSLGTDLQFWFFTCTMAIRVVGFSIGGFKIRKIFA